MKRYIKGELWCYEAMSCSIHPFLMLVRPLLHSLQQTQLALAHQGSCGECGSPWRRGPLSLILQMLSCAQIVPYAQRQKVEMRQNQTTGSCRSSKRSYLGHLLTYFCLNFFIFSQFFPVVYKLVKGSVSNPHSQSQSNPLLSLSLLYNLTSCHTGVHCTFITPSNSFSFSSLYNQHLGTFIAYLSHNSLLFIIVSPFDHQQQVGLICNKDGRSPSS